MAIKKRFAFVTDNYYAVDNNSCYEDQNEDYAGPAIDRLAEYESTGLMPAEVIALQYQLKHARRECDDATNKLVDLRMQHRWIPVSERLPEDDLPKDSKRKSIKVLVTYKTSKGVPVVRTQVREKEPWFNSKGWDWTKAEPITHWMPLPEPPKE